jgi:hypothetical protein
MLCPPHDATTTRTHGLPAPVSTGTGWSRVVTRSCGYGWLRVRVRVTSKPPAGHPCHSLRIQKTVTQPPPHGEDNDTLDKKAQYGHVDPDDDEGNEAYRKGSNDCGVDARHPNSYSSTEPDSEDEDAHREWEERQKRTERYRHHMAMDQEERYERRQQKDHMAVNRYCEDWEGQHTNRWEDIDRRRNQEGEGGQHDKRGKSGEEHRWEDEHDRGDQT